MARALMPKQCRLLDVVTGIFGASGRFARHGPWTNGGHGSPLAAIEGCWRRNPCRIGRHRHPGYGGHKRDAAGRIYGRPACIVSDNVLCQEQTRA